MNIIYLMDNDKTNITVIKIMLAENGSGATKLRTREWLEKVSEFIDFGDNEILPLETSPENDQEKKSEDKPG